MWKRRENESENIVNEIREDKKDSSKIANQKNIIKNKIKTKKDIDG